MNDEPRKPSGRGKPRGGSDDRFRSEGERGRTGGPKFAKAGGPKAGGKGPGGRFKRNDSEKNASGGAGPRPFRPKKQGDFRNRDEARGAGTEGPRRFGREGADGGSARSGQGRPWRGEGRSGESFEPRAPRPGRREREGAAGDYKPRSAEGRTRSGEHSEGRRFEKRSERPVTSGDFRPREFRPRRDDRDEGAERREGRGGFQSEGRGDQQRDRGQFRSESRTSGEFRPRRDARGEGAERRQGRGGSQSEGRGDQQRERGQFRPEGRPGPREDKGHFRPEGRERPAFGRDAARPHKEFRSERRDRGGPPAEEAAGERIAKRLARAGIASRRDAEALIADGRVKVNGRVLDTPAFNVMPDDAIEIDGAPLPPVERTRLFLFHKPAGVVTTSRDPEGRQTVFDVLPQDLPRLITVGRLDINTEGLLLLTNDGGLARTLELPATGWLRRYRVRVHGKVTQADLDKLKDGIAVDGIFYGSVEAILDREQGSNAWLTVGLREGKNREVKNILGALGLEVGRLIRVSFGPFQLGDLPEGHVQELKGRMLRDQLGERLIEESGANFDADIVKPFSNRPTAREEERSSRASTPERKPLVEGEGGLIKNRGRGRERMREDALGRLSTKPKRPGFGDGRPGKPERGPRKFGEREQRPIEPPGGRKSNVWMAPGARPQGKDDKAEPFGDRKGTAGKRFGKPGPRSDGGGGGRPHSGKPRRDK